MMHVCLPWYRLIFTKTCSRQLRATIPICFFRGGTYMFCIRTYCISYCCRRIGIFTTHSAAIMTSRVAVLLLMLLLVVGCWSPSNADVGVDGGGNSVKEKVRQERSPVKGEDDSVPSSSVNMRGGWRRRIWPLPRGFGGRFWRWG